MAAGLRRATATAVVLAACAGAGWMWWARARRIKERPVMVVVSGDTAGWITPCGCTSNQSGGLLRRATYLEGLGRGAAVIYADAGGAPAGASVYQRVKFEAIIKGESAMGIAAHNLGGPEAALGADWLREAQRRLGAPFISANLCDEEDRPIAPALRVVEAGGKRVALAGVVSTRYAGRGVHIQEPRAALLGALASAKGSYDALIVLAYMDEEELAALATALPEADAVIGGPTGQTVEPRYIGRVLMTSATNKGKFLCRLEPAGEQWRAEIVEMTGDYADAPGQKRNLADYLAELGRRDFAASETGLGPAAPGPWRIAGSASCTACHATAHQQWAASGHGRAWRSLVDKGNEVDPSCQVCHTTGYGLPGGFVSAERSAGLTSVGCEDCHGPSAAHAADPKVRTPFAAADQCLRCHDRENSPLFKYVDYWKRIEHGREKPVPSALRGQSPGMAIPGLYLWEEGAVAEGGEAE